MEVERIKMAGEGKKRIGAVWKFREKQVIGEDQTNFCMSWHKVRGAGNKEAWERYLDLKYMEEEVKEKQRKSGSKMRKY